MIQKIICLIYEEFDTPKGNEKMFFVFKYLNFENVNFSLLLELMGERERIVREGVVLGVVRGVARADTVPAGLESN